MKKILLSSLLLISGFFGFSQFDKGRAVLGGNVSGNTNSNFSSNTLSVNPQLGFALASNQLLVAQLGFNGYEASGGVSSRRYSFGLGYRKYYTLTDNLYFNWQAGGTFAQQRSKYSSGSNTSMSKSTSIGASISPGLSWAATPKLLLESRFGSIYYDHATGSNAYDQLGFTFNALYFGFTLKL